MGLDEGSSWWRRNQSETGPPGYGRPRSSPSQGGPGPKARARTARPEFRSDCLQRFINGLGYGGERHILDLGPISGSTSMCIGRLGHHAHFADLATSCERAREQLTRADGMTSPSALDRFVRGILNYPARSFDGVLAWDVLQQLEKPGMHSVLDQLLRILRPDSRVHCIFQPNTGAGTPALRYGVTSESSFSAARAHDRVLAQQVALKDLETIFSRFHSLCIFLRRQGGFLEVLVSS